MTNKEIKTARHIGTSKLLSLPNEILNIWSCGACGNLFNAVSKLNNKITICPCCRTEVRLDVKNGN